MALSGYVIAKHIQPSNVLSFYKLKEVYLKIDEQELLRACVFLKWLKMVFILFRAFGDSFEAHICF
jgi:hypothetical protein